jgi:hypothetical protein
VRNFTAHSSNLLKLDLRISSGYISLFWTMKLKDYREDLLEKLTDTEYAAEYFAQVLMAKDRAALLIALDDIIEAAAG